MFEIRYEEKDAIVFYNVSGFWEMPLLRKFQHELTVAIDIARRHSPDFKILSDSTEFAVQSAEVAREMTEMMAIGVKITSGRKAFVVRSALLKAQYKRTIGHSTVCFFSNVDDARAWLMAPL